MSDLRIINAVQRFDFGKVLSAKMRREEFIPAVIYSKGIENTHIKVSTEDVLSVLSDYKIMTKIICLKIGDKSVDAIIRDIQFNPVTDLPIHIDFMGVSEGVDVIVQAPVKVLNKHESIGVKRGGEVFLLKYNVPLKVKISKEPAEVLVDVAGSILGQKFHLSNCQLPANSSMIKDVLVAKIVGKRVAAKNNDAESSEEGKASDTPAKGKAESK